MKILTSITTLFALFVFAASANALPVVLLRAAEELHLAVTTLSVAGSVQFLGFFLATLVGGAISERCGKKLIILLAAGLMILGAGIVSGAQTGFFMAFGCGLLGMGGGIIESLSSAILVELFPTRRKLMLNLSQVIFCVGAVVVPLAMGWLLPRGVSWRLCFSMLAGLCGVLMLLTLRANFPAPVRAEEFSPSRLSGVLRRPAVLFPCVAIFTYVFSEFAIIMFANYYLSHFLDAPERWAIYSVALVWCTIGVGRLVCAAIPERHGYETLLSVLMVISALLMAAQAWAANWCAALVLFALTGLIFSGVWPMILGMVASRAPAQNMATVIGVTIAAGALGCVAAPPAMQWLFAHCEFNWVFPIAGLPLLVGAVAVHVGKGGMFNLSRLKQPQDALIVGVRLELDFPARSD